MGETVAQNVSICIHDVQHLKLLASQLCRQALLWNGEVLLVRSIYQELKPVATITVLPLLLHVARTPTD